MSRSRSLRFFALAGVLTAGCAGASATTRDVMVVSVRDDGGASNGSSYHTTISGSGGRVAFMSFARNLVAGDGNGQYDIFVRYVAAGHTVLASRASGATGAASNGRSSWPAISADGSQVAFQSFATNLVSGDRNGSADIFIRNLRSDTTRAVSRSDTDGGLGHDNSLDPAISRDGRFVAFQSFAPNLVAGDSNKRADVFVRDLRAGRTRIVSRARGGGGANGASDNPSISSDGRFVAFESSASNLVAADHNGVDDVFVRDLKRGTTRLVSRTRGGDAADGASYMPSVSGDGRWVAFASRAGNLVSRDRNGQEDVFVRDMWTGRTQLASRHERGDSGTRSIYPSISSDGRYLVFHSDAPDIVARDTNGQGDVFVRDLVLGRTRLVSHVRGDATAAADGYSGGPWISADGHFAAFASLAGDLVPRAGGQFAEIFRAALH